MFMSCIITYKVLSNFLFKDYVDMYVGDLLYVYFKGNNTLGSCMVRVYRNNGGHEYVCHSTTYYINKLIHDEKVLEECK